MEKVKEKMKTEEDYFYIELGKTIQSWLWIESEMYRLYSAIMGEANHHLVSVTFHHVESFESKCTLIDRCLKLMLDQKSEEYINWKKLRKKAQKLNLKRNKIVHEPVIISMQGSKIKNIYISTSFSNALALVKGHTSHQGPIMTIEYTPSQAKIKSEHKIDYLKLITIGKSFKDLSAELGKFKESILPIINNAHENVKSKKK